MISFSKILMEYCAGGSISDIQDAGEVQFTEPQIAAIMAYVILGFLSENSIIF